MSRAGATAAQRKRAAKHERRATSRAHRDAHEAFLYESAFVADLADFAYVQCEECGQEQTARHGGCVVCGHDVARTHPLHDEHKQALIDGYKRRISMIPLPGDGASRAIPDDGTTSTYTGIA